MVASWFGMGFLGLMKMVSIPLRAQVVASDCFPESGVCPNCKFQSPYGPEWLQVKINMQYGQQVFSFNPLTGRIGCKLEMQMMDIPGYLEFQSPYGPDWLQVGTITPEEKAELMVSIPLRAGLVAS